MALVEIRYLGKRAPLELKMPWLEKPVTFPKDRPIKMNRGDAHRLMHENPMGFEILYPKGRQMDNTVEAPAEIEKVEEVEIAIEDAEPEPSESGEEVEEEEQPVENGKSYHHMNKTELVAYAKRVFGEDLDPDISTRPALLNIVKDLVKGQKDDSD